MKREAIDLNQLRDDAMFMFEDFAALLGAELFAGYDLEGVFLPQGLDSHYPRTKNFPDDGVDLLSYRAACKKWRDELCSFLRGIIGKSHARMLDDIYPETSGLFLVESVTNKLSLVEAAKATAEIEKQIEIVVKGFGGLNTPVARGKFGVVEIPEYPDLLKLLGGKSPFLLREVFNVGGKHILPARNRHHHLSIMIGAEAAFAHSHLDNAGVHCFSYFAYDVAINGLINTKHSFPILRPDETSYLRAVDANGNRYDFEAINEKVGNGLIRYRPGSKPAENHLEFIAADANSDPRDAAIISALSLYQSLMGYAIRDKDGNIDLTSTGSLILDPAAKTLLGSWQTIIPGQVPASLAESLGKFNAASNPTFIALDKIADEYAKVVKQKYPHDFDRKQKAAQLQGLGTILYNGYLEMFAGKMKEYGITPQAKVQDSWRAEVAVRTPIVRQ